MTSPRPSPDGRLPAAVAALVTVAVGAATNIFTGALPEHWRWAHDWRLWGAVFGVLCGVTVWLAVSGAGPAGRRPGFGYGRRYRKWVLRAANTLDTKGLISIGPTTPDLETVFVDVTLTERAPAQVGPGLLDGAGGADVRRRSVWDFLDQPRRVVLVLLGAPGSGKTTLLRHVARETAGRRRGGRRPVPVLVQIRDRVATIVADPMIELPDLVRRSLPGPIGPGPAGWWERRLRAGQCVVLLDGLDEVAGEDDRRAVVAWINGRLPGYPGNDFVITSRPHGYRDSFVDTATTVQVLPFTPGQVERFLHNWYRAAEGDEARGREQAGHLLAQLHARPGLHDLTVNPLLLTMIATVHRYGGRPGLPDNRAALYREMCAVMLWRRDKEKGRHLEMLGPQRLALLARLACHWMELGVRDMDRRRLRDVVADAAPGVDADHFIAEMEATGLLQELAPRSVTFAHQTFQEYLAARHIAENGEAGILVRAVGDPWWRETTLLYAAEHDAAPVVDAALRSGTAPALSLAFEIADVDGRLPPELRGRLDDLLLGGLQPEAGPAHRQIAVEVLLGRLLRTATTTSSGTRIMRRPVTTDLYRLFLDDTGTPPPDAPEGAGTDTGGPLPDGPATAGTDTGGPLPDGRATAGTDVGAPADAGTGAGGPARGMWRTDAEAFVEWINGLVADGPRGPLVFRLPIPREVEPTRSTGPVWVRAPGDRRPQIRSPEGAPGPVTVADLVAATAADLRASRLFTDVLIEAGRRLAEQCRALSADLAGHAAQMHTATREYASARKTGMSLGQETRAQQRESRLGDGLSRAAGHLLATAEQLTTIVHGLATRDDVLAARLRQVDLTPARRSLELAERDSIRPVPAMRTLRATLPRIEDLVTAARSHLRRAGTAAPPWTPLDDILKPAAKAGLLPTFDDSSPDPVGAVVTTLVAESCPTEPRPVDLADLAAVVSRIGERSPGGHDHALDRLARVAEPVVTRRTTLTPAVAAAVRSAALILARRARAKTDHRLAGNLVDLAVGMSQLERRQQSPETRETLILAYD